VQVQERVQVQEQLQERVQMQERVQGRVQAQERLQAQERVQVQARVQVQERVQVQVQEQVQTRVCGYNSLMRRPAPFRKNLFNPMLVGELILLYQPTGRSAACPRQPPANALAADSTEQIIHGK